jgi:hypothetical protein
VRAVSDLVLASGTHDGGAQLTYVTYELAAGIVFVTEKDLASGAPASGKQVKAHLALVTLGRGEAERTRGATWGEDRAQPKPSELAGLRGAVPIVGIVAQDGLLDGLTTSGALDRRGVDQRQIVRANEALAGKDAHQPLECVGQPTPTREVSGLGG